MATARRAQEAVVVHEDDPSHGGDSTEDETEDMDESRASEEEQEDIEDGVMDDMVRFEQSFKNITQRYRFINRIGEGTFSTVYKAEDLLYDHYVNDWDADAEKENVDSQNSSKPSQPLPSKPRFVAIKKIYVTSSPTRILNELELLHDLRNSPNVCPLITAFRHQDQVIAILPFFQHQDFRDYYRSFTVSEMRIYFHSLFTAIKSTHEAEIIHRDIKPTNFLYSPAQQRGVLVDFGLAEREGTDWHQCVCCLKPPERQRKINSSVYSSARAAARAAGQTDVEPSYPKEDQRSSRRANRAGTRGFRAPEVLLKCTAQKCVIDVWSCGIILLTFLSKRFPFFHSADDIDAFLELCTIFGRKRMKEVALLHGQVMDTNIPTINDNGHSWEKIIMWTNGRSKKDGDAGLTEEEFEAVDFMKCCLELDHGKRMSAKQALEHPWLTGDFASDASSEVEMKAEG